MRVTTLVIATMLALLAVAACDRAEPEAEVRAAEAGESAEQEQAEQEAARQQALRARQQAVEEARSRLEPLRGRVRELRSSAEPVASSIDASLRQSIAALESRAEQIANDIETLGSAGVDTWEATRSEVSSSLGELGSRLDRVVESLEAQKQVLSRRDTERRPITGLFEGLDGGDYEAYRVSVVREVQQALKDRGYYPGPVDGYLGKPTMEALARFQREHGVVASGVPSPATRERLLAG